MSQVVCIGARGRGLGMIDSWRFTAPGYVKGSKPLDRCLVVLNLILPRWLPPEGQNVSPVEMGTVTFPPLADHDPWALSSGSRV